MFGLVRIAPRVAILMALLAGVTAPIVSADTPTGYTPAQIRAAIDGAEASSSLWATVNVCNSPSDPHSIGIRGQMPALGIPASLSMTVQIDYWSAKQKTFLPAPGASETVSLGDATTGLHQAGASFPFAPGSGVFSGSVTFRWLHGATVAATATRQVASGHPDADSSSPAHLSAARCSI
jgi:hypothetical protein